MREVVCEIAKTRKPGARVASETPGLAAYYAGQANRPDLVFVSISDPKALPELREGDFIVDARGRRYFSNEAIVSALKQTGAPAFTVSLGAVPSASIYLLDKRMQEVVVETARQLLAAAKETLGGVQTSATAAPQPPPASHRANHNLPASWKCSRRRASQTQE